jgi:hypothetical protein
LQLYQLQKLRRNCRYSTCFMKQLILLPCFIFLFSLSLFGQDSIKTNPVIYADGGFGIPLGDMSGLQLNAGLNYQAGKNLFTLRANAIGGNFPEGGISTTVPRRVSDLYEYGILYGRRFINGGRSFSFSAGIAYDDRPTSVTFKGVELRNFSSRYPAIPFELNWLWFQKNKQPNPLSLLFPVEKTTGYSGSVGLRLSGNISKYSYVALGAVFGLGWHRQY